MTSGVRNAMCIVCTDQWRSLDFYRDALGAELIPGDIGTCPWLRIGDLTITLLANTDKPSHLDFCEQAMAMLLLQVNDLEAAYERAIKHGARTIEALEPTGVHFVVADPDGVFIEVWQADSEAE